MRKIERAESPVVDPEAVAVITIGIIVQRDT